MMMPFCAAGLGVIAGWVAIADGMADEGMDDAGGAVAGAG